MKYIFCTTFVNKTERMKNSIYYASVVSMVVCSLAFSACQQQPSAVERRKAEIREKDSLELLQARQDLYVSDSILSFKTFEVEDLKAQFVFEKQEKYQTKGYYVLPAYRGSKEKYSFFPEVEEDGALLLVTIDKARKYTFKEVDFETENYKDLLPNQLTELQRRDVDACYALAKAMQDLSGVQQKKEKLQLKIRFYEEKMSRSLGTSAVAE